MGKNLKNYIKDERGQMRLIKGIHTETLSWLIQYQNSLVNTYIEEYKKILECKNLYVKAIESSVGKMTDKEWNDLNIKHLCHSQPKVRSAKDEYDKQVNALTINTMFTISQELMSSMKAEVGFTGTSFRLIVGDVPVATVNARVV